jgi:hypothetical protein
MTATQRIILHTTGRLAPFQGIGIDHPLAPLVRHYMDLRDVAQALERECEKKAPTPLTLAGEHPADGLTGWDAQVYAANHQKMETYAHAASMAHRALCAVIDNLGGL